MIVAFSGIAGSGKDTSADYLVAKHGFVKVAFADEMKRICARLYSHMTRERLWGPSQKRNEPIPEYPREHGPWVGKEGGYVCMCCNLHQFDIALKKKQCYLTARFALQILGTEFGRNCWESTWTNITLGNAQLLHANGIASGVNYSYTPWDGLICTDIPTGPVPKGVVISDLRWPAGNEGKEIQGKGGSLIKLLRGEGLGAGAGAHESEKCMDVPDSTFNAIIDNRNWSLMQLFEHLDFLADSGFRLEKVDK